MTIFNSYFDITRGYIKASRYNEPCQVEKTGVYHLVAKGPPFCWPTAEKRGPQSLVT